MEADSVHAVTETGSAQTEVETQQQWVTGMKTAHTKQSCHVETIYAIHFVTCSVHCPVLVLVS